MAFSFGFSGDDIEQDPNDILDQTQQQANSSNSHVPPPIPARAHDLDELLSTLPDKISYATIELPCQNGSPVCLPRRELFDVRIQLMAEDDGTSSAPLSGLDDSDLHPNVYEGGYKTWECSLSLASHLLSHNPLQPTSNTALPPQQQQQQHHHIIEMGCGSALPTLTLFQHAIRSNHATHFTLTDYNADVLRLVTLPNLLLAWAAALPPTESATIFTEHGNPLLPAADGSHAQAQDTADFYLTPTVKARFVASLAARGILLTLLSGSWTPVALFTGLVPAPCEAEVLVLGSETIYSLESLATFTEAMVALMGRARRGMALVAAKKVYFGVGGSVDGFREECARLGAVVREVEREERGKEGVKRWLGEVRMMG